MSARQSAGFPIFVLCFAFVGVMLVPQAYSAAAQGDRKPGGQTAGVEKSSTDDVEESSGSPRIADSGSFLDWMREASGPIGLVILLLSFYLIALVVWMSIEYRRKVALPPLLLRELNDLLTQKRFNDAYHRVANDRSFLARVLAAGARKLSLGRDAALLSADLANEDLTMEMEHKTTYLATVGTLGPMIGLVGTVYGMIMSFRVMAFEGALPRASQLASGISTALFATLEGIALSIPAICFHAFFRNRIARLSLEVTMAAESLLDQFAPGAKPASTMGGLCSACKGLGPRNRARFTSARLSCRPSAVRPRAIRSANSTPKDKARIRKAEIARRAFPSDRST